VAINRLEIQSNKNEDIILKLVDINNGISNDNIKLFIDIKMVNKRKIIDVIIKIIKIVDIIAPQAIVLFKLINKIISNFTIIIIRGIKCINKDKNNLEDEFSKFIDSDIL